MNDFTKEELQYLRDRIYERPNNITKNMENMRNKLQFLIDNYCEHTNTRNGDPCYECEDCGKQLC